MEQAIIRKTTRQQLAAQNNADLYKHMFKAHGIAFEASKDLFQCIGEPLPFYSSIVTLSYPTARSNPEPCP